MLAVQLKACLDLQCSVDLYFFFLESIIDEQC